MIVGREVGERKRNKGESEYWVTSHSKFLNTWEITKKDPIK